jgi:hypothetical protein
MVATSAIPHPPIVPRAQWLPERKKLPAREGFISCGVLPSPFRKVVWEHGGTGVAMCANP